MEVLQLDMSGRPQSWISAKEAAVIYASDGVAWTLGEAFHVLRGGTQRRTGLQSRIEVHPIIAVRGAVPSRAWRKTPALTQPEAVRPRSPGLRLLRRPLPRRRADARAHRADLARRPRQLDELHHRLPRRATATRATACPKRRACRCMYLPYVPSLHEDMILRGRRILADQMEFLLASVPRSSRLHG